MKTCLINALLIAACSFGFISTFSYASKIPVVSSIDVGAPNPLSGERSYHVESKLIEGGPAGDAIVPANWYVGFIIHTNDMAWMPGAYAIPKSQTYSEAGIAFYNSRPAYSFYSTSTTCVGMGYDMRNDDTWGGATMPGGCFLVPPSDEWCKITTPELVLDHGRTTLQNAEGHSATANLGLSCTRDMAVKFNLVTNDKYVYLDEGKSEIAVDNKPLNTAINLPQGESSLQIKDSLSGIHTEGPHMGSSVLVMMPY